jgi:hypothetical protein
VTAESWSQTYKLQQFEQREESGLETRESLKRRDLLSFAISHNKVVKVLEDIGIKCFKSGPFRGII